ncbi:MAG TPA: DUF551 domain-containing protein [Pricia sp.]|nr:DUF551 domain-containing protein [Pricia sp.]
MEWISVKERLPKDRKYRFVLMENGIHICRYNEEKNVFIDREYYHNESVTHWCEIEPPKDKDQ